MATQRELERQGGALQALDNIVSGMKAYAGVTIRKTQGQVPGVHAYEAHVFEVLADLAPHFPDLLQARPPGEKRILVAFGSSQGLCGGFNERLAGVVAAEASGDDLLVVIGGRLKALLDARRTVYARFHDAVVSVNAIAPALRGVVAQIREDYGRGRYYDLTALYTTVEGNRPEIRVERILPPDPAAIGFRRREPDGIAFYLEPRQVLEAALQEYLGIGLFHSCLESLRSENWYRLRSLEGASENIKRRLGEIRTQRRYLTQEEVTEEMLEILGNGMFFGGSAAFEGG